MGRYVSSTGTVFSLQYHLVWCPKYRRPVLVPPVDDRLEVLLQEKAEELGITMHLIEIRPDHVHLFVESDPTRCVAELVSRLKGFTSRQLRSEFPSLRSRLPALWSRNYYAGTEGYLSGIAVRQYVEAQKGK